MSVKPQEKSGIVKILERLVKRGELSIGISTGGASPSAAVYVKEQIERILPEDFDALLEELAALRPRVMEQAEEQTRGGIFKELFVCRLISGAPLDEETIRRILAGEEK